MSNFTIGKLAKSAAVGVETIRFYERMGLVRRPEKRRNGFRQYAAEDSTRIRFIKRAQELGYTLREIKELLALGDDPQTTCAEYAAGIEAKLAELDGKIQDLKRMKRSLSDILAMCEIDSCAEECKPLACFESGCEVSGLDQKR